MNLVLTVDFDDTLFSDPTTSSSGGLWIPTGASAEPVVRVHNLVREKAKEGFDIHVVTFRRKEYISECWDLIKLYELPIISVVSTEGKNKTPFLKELNSSLHIDDSVEVCLLAQQAGIDVLLVDWNQKDWNCTAELFNKI